MAQWQWPGTSITFPYTETFNNAFASAAFANGAYTDTNSPIVQAGGPRSNLAVYYGFLGAGEQVEFTATAADCGVDVVLYDLLAVQDPALRHMIAESSAGTGQLAVLTHFLIAGRMYYLEVGNNTGVGADITVQMRVPTPSSVSTHYWPGENIGPLPAAKVWDSHAWDTLPVAAPGHDPTNDPDNLYVGIVGWDLPLYLQTTQGHLGQPPGGGGATWWSIVGTGEEVTFRTAGESFGHVLFLIVPDFTPGISGIKGWVKVAQAPYPGDAHKATALTYLLEAGVTYHLYVGSYTTTAPNRLDAATGMQVAVYGQSFRMTVELTDRPTNTVSGNAADVTIASDGATYHSHKCLNALNEATDFDSPSGFLLARPFWWKYTPETATDYTFTAYCDPADWGFGAAYILKNSDGSWGSLGSMGSHTHTGHLGAGQSVWFAAGVGSTQFRDPGEIFSITVTGARSVVQAPVINLAPVNDLRSHATTVKILTNGGTYLSVDTLLSYANPGVVDTVGPFVQDTDAVPLYQTAWWKYEPVVSGSATFRAHSSPVDSPIARIMVLDDTTVLQSTGMSNDLVFPVTRGHTYYIVLGTSEASSTLSASFSVVGPPAGGDPPVNDLRSHATAVKIPSEYATYLSVDTSLSFATPSAAGAIAGPYVPDLEASPLYQTAWWKYRPTASGLVTIRAHSNPADTAAVKLMILHDGPIFPLAGTLPVVATVDLSTDYSHSVNAGEGYYYVLGTTAQAFASASFGMTGPVTTSQNPETYTPPIVDPPTAENPGNTFDPGATQPAVDTGQDTLLNLVRIFSSKVKRAVRIIDSNTIEMVDPAAPLPLTLRAANAADSLYSSSTNASAATDAVLSTNAGKVTVTGSAELVTDDLRVVRSTWRIPDRLPVFQRPAAPVQRISYTFSPQGFHASVEFQFPAVPLIDRRP